jgi:membrane-associated phospholipid phosphatase
MNVFLSWQGHEALPVEISTMLAVLAACALWPIPCVRWLAALAALYITISTLTFGWNSGVNVVAGALLALVCCRLGLALVGLANPRPRSDANPRERG